MKKIISATAIIMILLTGCDQKPADLTDAEMKKLEKLAKTANVSKLKREYQKFVFNNQEYRANIISERIPPAFQKEVHETKAKLIVGIQQIIAKLKSGEISKQQVEMLFMMGQMSYFGQVKDIKEKYLPELQKLLRAKK